MRDKELTHVRIIMTNSCSALFEPLLPVFKKQTFAGEFADAQPIEQRDGYGEDSRVSYEITKGGIEFVQPAAHTRETDFKVRIPEWSDVDSGDGI